MTDIQLGPPEAWSPHNQAVYEAGKQMLVDSVSIGRDFCKFMVGVSTGAIPLYLALLQLAVPKDYRPGWGEGALEVAPGALFLAAAATFAVGMLPRRSDVSLDNVEATEALRVEVMTQRARFTYVGFALFGVAALASIVITIVALGFKPAAPAPAKPLQVQIVHP